MKETKDYSLGKIDFVWKRNVDDPRYIYSKFEERESLNCEFINTIAELSYASIPEAHIGQYLEIKYVLKNKKQMPVTYTISIGNFFLFIKKR